MVGNKNLVMEDSRNVTVTNEMVEALDDLVLSPTKSQVNQAEHNNSNESAEKKELIEEKLPLRTSELKRTLDSFLINDNITIVSKSSVIEEVDDEDDEEDEDISDAESSPGKRDTVSLPQVTHKMPNNSRPTRHSEANRRATTNKTEFLYEDLDVFDINFGREHFFQDLGKNVMLGPALRKTKELQDVSVPATRTGTNSRGGYNFVPIKSGFLFKQGGVVKSWKRRWFVLGRSEKGPVLAYYTSQEDSSPRKVIPLGSTSSTMSINDKKVSKDFSFKLSSSVDSYEREYYLAAENIFEMTSWFAAIESTIAEANDESFKGQFNFLWSTAGIDAFLVRYGVRKRNSRGQLQTRVIELNFADHTIHNTKRGETQTSLPFSVIRKVVVCAAEREGDGYGIQIDFSGLHRSWPLYHDTKQCRDDMLSLLQHVINQDVNVDSLRRRMSNFVLKRGIVERKNISNENSHVGPHATIKGRLCLILHEYQLEVYSAEGKTRRPWFVFSLPGLALSHKSSKRIISLGRHHFVCDSEEKSKEWFQAIQVAAAIPKEVIQQELDIREKIKDNFTNTVMLLRKLLKARVKPQSNAPPEDQETITWMLQVLWNLVFLDEPWGTNASSKWLEIGFQRGGPADDLRASGLLGLHCLIYMVKKYPDTFKNIVERQIRYSSTGRAAEQGRILNYPIAIACINVVGLLVEMLGIGDAGIHSQGCSQAGPKVFAHFVSLSMNFDDSDKSEDHDSDDNIRDVPEGPHKEVFEKWKQSLHHFTNFVFEEMFCILFPVLDRLFVEMGAGYMEFGQVLLALRRRIESIFIQGPSSIQDLRKISLEPCTDVLVAPSEISSAAAIPH